MFFCVDLLLVEVFEALCMALVANGDARDHKEHDGYHHERRQP